MRTPEEVTLALKESSDIFTIIVGKPDDNDLSEITNSLISILMRVVKFDGTANVHKLLGVVATNEDYLTTTGQATIFAIPVILFIYKNTIPADATTAT